jgi:hypothetical protein
MEESKGLIVWTGTMRRTMETKRYLEDDGFDCISSPLLNEVGHPACSRTLHAVVPCMQSYLLTSAFLLCADALRRLRRQELRLLALKHKRGGGQGEG